MNVAAVATIYNEGDIIAVTLAHLHAQGISRIYAACRPSDDETEKLLHAFGAVVLEDHDEYHHQPKWIDKLAGLAAGDGAEWIIPFDADEFWYVEGGGTIPEALTDIPDAVTKMYAPMWQHHDWQHKEPIAKPLCKVAYRWTPDAHIHPGNHGVDLVGAAVTGPLAIRELQFRSFEHFCRKVHERSTLIDPTLGPGFGTHMTRLANATPEEMHEEWDAYLSRETVDDPIPYGVDHRPGVQPSVLDAGMSRRSV